MAYDDALFQLGMDLTRSSTAQKEDIGDFARVARFDDTAYAQAKQARSAFAEERSHSSFGGTNLIIDLYGANRLDDRDHIERTLKRWVELTGASLRHIHLHDTGDHGGVAGVVVFDTGHASIRTFPERAFAAVDVMYMDLNGQTRQSVTAAAEQAFLPGSLQSRVVRRAEDKRRAALVAPVVQAVKPARVRRAA